MLVFDENVHYEKLINNGFEKYPNKRDLTILCKHWLDENNSLSDLELKDKMIAFCIKHNSQFNVARSENLLIKVLNGLKEQPSFEFNKNIIITKQEINTLKSIKNFKEQKVLFVIICLAKWRNANFIYLNEESTIKLQDIFSLANVKATKKEQLLLLHNLNEQGLIDVQLKPILKCFIPCINEQDEKVLEFTISDNMISEWLWFILPHCAKCNKPFEKNSNKQKYCKDCAKIVKNEQNKSYLKH